MKNQEFNVGDVFKASTGEVFKVTLTNENKTEAVMLDRETLVPSNFYLKGDTSSFVGMIRSTGAVNISEKSANAEGLN